MPMRNDAPGSPGLARRRWLLLGIGIGVAMVAAMFALPRIPQDPGYHNFADTRPWLGIPNFLDVASNLPFLVVGLLGLILVFPLLGHATWHAYKAVR